MSKGKLERFAENGTFGNVFEPLYEDVIPEFCMKGKWSSDFFRNSNPIVLELACGKGEYTVNLAERNPDINYIGIDIKGARLWRGAKTAFDKKLTNVAFLRVQIDQIDRCFAKDEVNEIWITFPDPQPRLSRARRRLTSPKFLGKFKKIIKQNGFIHLKTDDQGLFEYTNEILVAESNHVLIEHSRDVYNSPVADEVINIQTFYEKMFLAENKPIYYLKFKMS